MKQTELLRMAEWLLMAVLLYAAAQILTYTGMQPQIQIVCWKLGHVTLGAFAGYWIDRRAFRARMEAYSSPLVQIRRAIIMAASMYTIGAGM